MISKFKERNINLSLRKTRACVTFNVYDDVVVSGVQTKMTATDFPFMMTIIRTSKCNNDDLYAIVLGLSLWSKDELKEHEGLLFISKKQFFDMFTRQPSDRLYTESNIKELLHSKYISTLTTMDYAKVGFIGNIYRYKSSIIKNKSGELGVYFECLDN